MAETVALCPPVILPESKETTEDMEMEPVVQESAGVEKMVTEPETEGESKGEETKGEPEGVDELEAIMDKEPGTPETEILDNSVSAEETDTKTEPKDEVDEKPGEELLESENVTKAVTVAEEDIEDDIIVLDDEVEHPESSQSGASNSKRPRKDLGEIMDVEDGIESKKGTIKKVIRQLSRADLEDLVLAKIVEAIVAHTDVGHLRSKVLELQIQKDKMATKMAVMMKQVAELSSAVNVIMENEARDPKNRIGAKPHVIRFNRSVGLQTSIEPGVRSAPPRIIRVPDASQNGVKQYGSSTGKQPVYAAATNGTFLAPQGQGVKRVYQANKSGDKSGQAGNAQQSPRKTYSAAGSNQARVHPIAPKPAVTQSVTVTAPVVTSQNVQPGIVDLTDDDPPAGGGSTSQASATTPGGTTIINGVQYQIVSNRGPTTPGNVQIVSPNSGQQKFIVTPATTPRPMLLQQVVGGPGTSNQQFMLRGVNTVSPVTLVQRPVAPRPVGNVNMPRVAATIPVRPQTGVVLATSSNTQRRFVLPPLPSTPTAKVKNDMFKAPPKPELTLNEQADGIVLSWNLPSVNNMAEVTTYQIFACQESLNNSPNRPSQWKRVGDVKALPLPMACTLSQFTEENRYYFIVRGIDVYGRVGPFCDPQNILLRRKK